MEKGKIRKNHKVTLEFDDNGNIMGIFDTEGNKLKEIKLPEDLKFNHIKFNAVIVGMVHPGIISICPNGYCPIIIGGKAYCKPC